MTTQFHDHSHSVAVGERALGHIKRLNLSAEPSSYELWYAYATGHDPALNAGIDGVLTSKGTLSEADMTGLRRRHLAAAAAADRLGAIGEELGDEVEQVVGMIEAAIGVSTDFDSGLSESSRRLARTVDRDTLRALIAAVVSATKEMQRENTKLGDSLKESRHDISKLQESLVSIRMQALTDPLTGLANRRHFEQFLSEAVVEAKRSARPLSLLFADVDHFKSFNDRHGHQLGDQVLRLIASTLKLHVKGQDFVARYGGEEFAIVLPDTDLREAIIVAENVRRAAAAKEVVRRPSGERLGRVTISIGVARLNEDDTPMALIEFADACLYAAKKNGRNCVMCEADPGIGTGTPAADLDR